MKLKFDSKAQAYDILKILRKVENDRKEDKSFYISETVDLSIQAIKNRLADLIYDLEEIEKNEN